MSDEQTQEQIFNAIYDYSVTIENIRRKYAQDDKDRKEGNPVKSAGFERAIKLQKAKIARLSLLQRLEPLKLVWSHPFPESLPAALKRTQNEVREFMGLPPVES